MADNDSRGNGQDPWGRSPEEGPDLVSVLKKLFGGKGSDGDEGQPSSNRFTILGLVALVLLWGLSGIFVVKPAEEAVILRFGKYVTTVGPGPHWIPRFIESKTVLNVQQVDNFASDADMLTRDENIVSVALAVQYRINDPQNYLFNVVNPVQTLQQATSSALRQVVGQMTLDSVLTTGRQELRDAVAKQLNLTLALYKTGLEVTDVTLQPAKPPEAVTEAFDDAIKAREDEQRYINKAEAYARKWFSVAKGKVARIQQSATAYKREVVLRSQGQTARYLALLKPYVAAPGVTGERLYLDAVTAVLSRTSNIVVDSGGSNVLYLPLDQILRRQMNGLQKKSVSIRDNSVAVKQSPPADTTNKTSTTSTSVYHNTARPDYPVGGNR